ncbi:UDP-4-amino-4,6-dideoxy-N-acetyl-beta-L-altrosamine N-acetyltransferase [Croceibacter atlanticus]|uniref:Flagellin modification protein FlmH n=1 Tax=Croceibacter atlanticus (strain ATCC BAA-628 / JCM 21780 / CIP 108009 / IAM 15332 / KCTC 12090 / HTCC2559) TaxID=216432 RepID=A3UAY3_CROAH|nr:UDP-4-amino-4,6-dideoxy-N-acetyl-beta-L-altrosamine N-acetyltransferase [Croceibacter atlanticus]EAP86969.1 flagellin modification protein FlmH [Croceibacter atlanticus HTCC2559]
MNDIKLVSLSEEHLEMVRNWRNSDEVSYYMYTDKKITKKQQVEWFKNVKQSESCKYWLIEFNGNYLGLASLTDINKTLSSCYWAFYLGESSIRGAGIGGKVEFNVLKYVFEELNLNKLRCEVFEFNDKVIRMHEKYGFRREAFYREHCFKNNQWHNVVGLALLKREWLLLKNIIHEQVYK